MDIYEFENDIKEYRKQIMEVLVELQNKFGISVSEEECLQPLWDMIAEIEYTIVRIESGIRMKKQHDDKKRYYKKYPQTYKMMKEVLGHK